MKIKFLILLCAILACFNSSASIGKDDLIGAVKGRYILQTNEVGEIHFLIRSTGKLQVIKSDWYNLNESSDDYPAKMTIEQGDNGLLRGMPVAHLIFSEGADEQAIDCHLLLTAEQGWDGEGLTIRLLSSFALENDGPNEIASVLSTKLTLLKYSVSAKKFIPVK
ncbi:hypothetical protein [Halobacteriovorax sp. JY17]|uniref:hypothetical protein n=1 Tax=Halobacteriovorax sp. JY17 TaxID=2014617 RepID=UPI000C6A3AAF|nr:hypothetical protein [Halobacteriovorax sp. JY17]PIK15078.1 MAG: hypothetical protein CES88_12140 [Halobacteriovorax sp. JY17]